MWGSPLRRNPLGSRRRFAPLCRWRLAGRQEVNAPRHVAAAAAQGVADVLGRQAAQGAEIKALGQVVRQQAD